MFAEWNVKNKQKELGNIVKKQIGVDNQTIE